MTFQLQHGLPDRYRLAAAALYWQAFGGKLGPVLGPKARALTFLTRVMQLDHCLAALQDDVLIGIVGYRSERGSFAGGTMADLQAVYGAVGMAWRWPLLAYLSDDDDRFLLDGISVAENMRGQGVGTALIKGICALGCHRGHRALRLDVIDSNWRAKALYQRQGFSVETSKSIGPLRYIFGFDQVVTMVKPLA
jgi:ribosomal protein S18 acetylase RimI-like enzyme